MLAFGRRSTPPHSAREPEVGSRNAIAAFSPVRSGESSSGVSSYISQLC